MYSPGGMSSFEVFDVTDGDVLGGLSGGNGLAPVEDRCGSLSRIGGDPERCESVEDARGRGPSVILRLFDGLNVPGWASPCD